MNLLPKYRQALAFIDQNVDGISTDNTDRKIVAGALFEAASTHSKGVCILLEQQLYASASALQRILFETFIRASWFLHCANDEEIRKFISKDIIEHSFAELIAAVEEEQEWPDTLSKIKSKIWRAMNSYTHGGYMQVERHYDGSSIMQIYSPEEKEEMTKFSSMIAFLAYAQVIDMSNNREKDKSIEDLYNQVKWCIDT